MIFWIILYILLTNLLISAWVRYDARVRMINYQRWYKFCVFIPIIGACFYCATKRSWKAWMLISTFWIFVPLMYLLVLLIMKVIAQKTGA
jgi:hypothetical protein